MSTPTEFAAVNPHENAPGPAPQLFIKGLSARIGEQLLPVDQAIADGVYDEDQAQKDGYKSLRQSNESVRDMAADVASQALERAGTAGNALGLVTFTSIHDHGEARLWQPATYLMKRLGADHALAWNLGMGCNGLVLSMLQASLLLPRLSGPALIVGADRFSGTSFDRWTSDRGLAYGDAATSVVLSTTSGFAKVLYIDVAYASALEELHRGGQPGHGWDVTASKRAFMNRHGAQFFFDEVNSALARLKRSLKRFLEQEKLSLAAVVTPFVGDSVRSTTYDEVFGPLAPLNTIAFGQGIGHTGTSDQILGLAHLIDSGALNAGDHVLLIGAGAGFSVTATILHLSSIPDHALLGETQ